MTEYASHAKFAAAYANGGIDSVEYWDIFECWVFNRSYRHCRIGKIKMKGKA